jgi:Zn-dependent membrane protease YugP
VPTLISGANAARRLLDTAGLHQVGIEQVPGQLSDHYDPSDKVLRLSPEIYHGHDMAAVGVAAHEAGHAIQDAEGYTPLVLRNLAVPMASFGGSIGLWVIIGGFFFHQPWLIIAGLILFGSVVVFQLINLPVEYDASERAKVLLVEGGIVKAQELSYVENVLSAAALTYVAATLQSIMVLAYYLFRFNQSRDRYA